MTWVEYLPYAVITGLLSIVLLHYRKVQNGKLIPRETVDLMLKAAQDEASAARTDATDRVTAMRSELTSRMDNFRTDQQAHITQLREDFTKAAEAVERTYVKILETKDRDLDQLWGALHASDEANKQEIGAAIEEMLANSRATARFFREWQARTGGSSSAPELPRVVGDNRE